MFHPASRQIHVVPPLIKSDLSQWKGTGTWNAFPLAEDYSGSGSRCGSGSSVLTRIRPDYPLQVPRMHSLLQFEASQKESALRQRGQKRDEKINGNKIEAPPTGIWLYIPYLLCIMAKYFILKQKFHRNFKTFGEEAQIYVTFFP